MKGQTNLPPKSLEVLLIEDNPDYADLVQHWFSAPGEDPGFHLNWTDSLADGLQRMARGGVDVVLLDLNLPDSNGVETFLKLRSHASGIPVVVLSAADNEPQALQLIQEGAENYLDKSSCDRQLLSRALRYAVVKHHSQASRLAQDGRQATIAGVLAAKGGAGATTTACNLAAELRQQTGSPVLLADLDLAGGMGSFLTGIEPKYSLDYAIANLHRLDRSFWDGMVAHGPDLFDFISAPAQPNAGELSLDCVRESLARMRPWYGWIVLDLGRIGKLSLGLVDQVDELIVVTKTTLPELYQAKRTVEALGKAGIERERIRLAINESGSQKGFSHSDLSSIFGIQVCATLVDSSEQLDSACLARRLPDKSSAIRRELGRLARKLAGLPEVKPKRMLPLLSFAQRLRKRGENGAVGENAAVMESAQRAEK